MQSATTSVTSGEWRYDADTCSFVSDGAVIRVTALRASEAALLEGAREQAEHLYCNLFEFANRPIARAKSAVARSFQEPTDPVEAARPARTILVYYDTKPEAPSDRVAGYTRVAFDGERVLVSSFAVTSALTEGAQQQLLRATVLATEALALEMARGALKEQLSQPLMIWRGQLGASDYLKDLYEREGYSPKLTERLEMTAWLKELGSADARIDGSEVDDVEIRPLNLANDDLVAVYDVLKDAFGNSQPSFEAWKRHYAQQPRFASEMSAVAWVGEKPIGVSCIELIVESEGGGEEEVARVFATDAALPDVAKAESLSQSLQFPDDYEERKNKIRANAKVGAAARAGLDSVFLGTDRQNPPAVRAYVRAGMVETKAENHGFVTAKVVVGAT